MKAKGTFEVAAQPEPPYEVIDGVALGRVRLEKRFSGQLEATAVVQMIAARTPVEGSAGYVAIERVTGTLAGRRGTFVLQHRGVMNRGTTSLEVAVVPDAATGELRGLCGTMSIHVVDGQHCYDFEYDLPT